MKRTRLMVFCLIAILCVSSLAGCGNSTGSTTGTVANGTTVAGETNAAPAKVEKVVFSYLSFNRIPTDIERISEAVNKITREKYGVEVELQISGPAEYTQKVNLALQSGSQVDLFLPGLGQFMTYVARNQAYPMEGLIDQHGKEMKEIITKDFGEDLLKATTVNGHLYSIPVNKGMSIPLNFMYNADMLKEAGLTADDITSMEDLPKVFAAVKAKFPDVVPFTPINVNPTDTGLLYYLRGAYEVDLLSESSNVGVLIGDSKKVENFFASDVFKKGVYMMRDWYQSGYLQKDVATTTSNSSEMISSGRAFSFMGGYSGMEASKAISAQTSKNISSKRLAPFYFDTSATNAVVWMMSSTTKVPEAAMRFLNATYADKDVLNTILYGIEGEDYVKVDENHVRYPDGLDAQTVKYTAQLCSGLMGSESLQLQPEGMNMEDVAFKLKENKETKRSPNFGFMFDPTDVRTELAAISNVTNQYLPVLVSGSVDPEISLPKFIQALNDAGAQTLIQKQQEQYDKWLAAQ